MSDNEYKWREYPRFVELCNKPGGVDEIEDAEWGQLALHFAPLLVKRCSEFYERVERLQSQVSTAVDIINHGVDLMTSEQVGQWTGVRTFLEQDTEDYEKLVLDMLK